ncbi:MAG: hypothetical protein R2932_59745 [Caldilineaceae bacterium]
MVASATSLGQDGLGRVDFTYDYTDDATASQGNAVPTVDLVTPDNLYSSKPATLCCIWPVAPALLPAPRRSICIAIILVDWHWLPTMQERWSSVVTMILTALCWSASSGECCAGWLRRRCCRRLERTRLFAGPLLSSTSGPVHQFRSDKVGNMLDPLAWASYAYCRGNPVSYADPSGRSFWRVFILVVAIVALVALTIVTLGASTPLAIAIGIGVLAGGVVGGISAARAKGDAGDIVTGILVGMAVGGWGAFLGGSISAIVGKLGSGRSDRRLLAVLVARSTARQWDLPLDLVPRAKPPRS